LRKSLRRRIRRDFGKPNLDAAIALYLAQLRLANDALVADGELVAAAGATACKDGAAVL
jgi:hypothetical protein